MTINGVFYTGNCGICLHFMVYMCCCALHSTKYLCSSTLNGRYTRLTYGRQKITGWWLVDRSHVRSRWVAARYRGGGGLCPRAVSSTNQRHTRHRKNFLLLVVVHSSSRGGAVTRSYYVKREREPRPRARVSRLSTTRIDKDTPLAIGEGEGILSVSTRGA